MPIKNTFALDEHGRMRQSVYDQLRSWGHLTGDEWSMASRLAQLIGRAEGRFQLGDLLTDIEMGHVEKLLGPHGYTYYRVLLARLEDTST